MSKKTEMKIVTPIELWYMQARHKFVWDNDTLEQYVHILQKVVYHILEEYDNDSQYLKQLASPNIGFFNITDGNEQDRVTGYALYTSDSRIPGDGRRTIFSEFKNIYEVHMARGLAGEMLHSNDVIRGIFPKDHAERVIQLRNERQKLIGDFMRLANKSINHRRAISVRLRYQILRRDNFTCQNCGRKAPEVRLHIDHIEPVSWGTNWKTSNDPGDYQTLCQDCNLGKGDLSWMFEL
jgi:hypothetical protein